MYKIKDDKMLTRAPSDFSEPRKHLYKLPQSVLLSATQFSADGIGARENNSVRPEGGVLLVHPHTGAGPTIAVVEFAIPMNTISITCDCKTVLEDAPAIEYAAFLVDDFEFMDVSYEDAAWYLVHPNDTVSITIDCEGLIGPQTRLCLATRLPPGIPDNNGWSTWQSVTLAEVRTATGFGIETPAPAEVDAGDELAAAATLFDREYYLSMYDDVRKAEINPLAHFTEFGWRENRNPSPYFDTWHFLRSIQNTIPAKSNPLDYYINAKDKFNLATRPQNSFVVPIDRAVRTRGKPLRVAIHAHIHYPGFIEELYAYIDPLDMDLSVFITTNAECDARFINAFLSAKRFRHHYDVRVVKNAGRDLGPMLVSIHDVWSNFDVLGHIHSKRSPHVSFGEQWRSYLMDQMFGTGFLVTNVINQFIENESLAVTFPDNYFEIKKFMQYDLNKATTELLLSRAGVDSDSGPENLSVYAAGSMAWFRTSVFREFVKTFNSIDEFDSEVGQLDSTLAHALERALPLIACKKGFVCAPYYPLRKPSPPKFERLYEYGPYKDEPGQRWRRDEAGIANNARLPLSPVSRVFDEKSLLIHWIIPAFGSKGAGGHMTIFRIVRFLESFGHRQTLWIQNGDTAKPPMEIKNEISRFYQVIGENVQVRQLPDDVRQLSGDVIVATDVWTVFPALATANFKERFYFVQDFEPYFHPVGDNYLLAEQTYRLGLFGLCAGKWLIEMVGKYGMSAERWNLAVDKDIFFPKIANDSAQNRTFKIAFYSRGYTPRRAKALGLAAFDQLTRDAVDFSVIMFGEAPTTETFPFKCEQRGILSQDDLAKLYRECDVGVVFSTTNYSLIPMEMMACGLPVVEIDTESTRTAFPNEEVTFAEPTPRGVANAVLSLIRDPEGAKKQVERAQSFIAGLDWESSAKAVEKAMLARLSALGFEPIRPADLCLPSHIEKTEASIVIPTYNGGELFGKCLERVVAQQGMNKLDILVIDSGSDDKTVEIVKKYKRSVRLIEIPNKEFQHGRTRNLGISEAEGEFVALITQDALPADEYWLSKLISGFSRSDKVAGVFGRHRAYPEHSGFEARDLDQMFDRFRDYGDVYSWSGSLPSIFHPGAPNWQLALQFYSDNNSAIRKSVWKVLPYPDIEWGEDQVWAWEMLKAGFQKVFVEDATVFHSHPDVLAAKYRVAVTEGRFFSKHFGWNMAPKNLQQALEHSAARNRKYAFEARIPHDELRKRMELERVILEGRAAGSDADWK